MLEFDEASHTYTLDGRRLPSVTQVLEPLQILEGIPAETLELARDRGHKVHHAIALMLQKHLEWSSVGTDIMGYVLAAKRFIQECSVRVLVVEHRLCDPGLKVAGTVDLIGIMGAKTGLFDWKAVAQVSRTAALQTAGYDYLYRKKMGGRPMGRYAVQLFEDETYKLYPFEDPRDQQWFMSALNLWHWKNQ